MALIHYYKMNGNLFDSIGKFDLKTDIGSLAFTTGKLGGATGALSLTSQYGCSGSGAASSAFMSENSTEASNGVTDWSICFWLQITNRTVFQNIMVVNAPGGFVSLTVQWDEKNGVLRLNGSASLPIIDGNWHFIYYRKSGTSVYGSIDAGSETTPITYSGTYSKFDGLKIGALTSMGVTAFNIDEIRVFNTTSTTSDRNTIYNSGSPAEVSISTPTAWQNPIHQHKLNGALTDTVGSVTATQTGGGYLGAGMFNASSNSRYLAANSDTLETSNASFGGTSTSAGSFTFFCWYNCTNYNGAMTPPNFACGPVSHSMYGGGPSTTFNSITVSDNNGAAANNWVAICMYSYDDISKRLVIYGYNGSSTVIALAEISSSRPATNISGWSFNNGMGMMGPATSYIDEVRMYDQALNGLNMLELWNGGSGTETIAAATTPATGSLPTVTMSGPAGTASAATNGNASGAGVTITMTAASGSATPIFTGTGSLPTITMTSAAGSGTGTASKSAAFVTITMQSMTGGVGSFGIGGLQTITVTAPSGSAAVFKNASTSGSLATITIYAIQASFPATPTHIWQFQNTLTDSIGGLTLVPYGSSSVDYINDPIHYDPTGNSKSLRMSQADTAASTFNLEVPYAGTVYNPANAATLSWTVCYWIDSPSVGTVLNDYSFTQYARTEIYILSTKLEIVRLCQIYSKFVNIRIENIEASGDLEGTVVFSQPSEALNINTTSSRLIKTPNFIAITYNASSQTLLFYWPNTVNGPLVLQASFLNHPPSIYRPYGTNLIQAVQYFSYQWNGGSTLTNSIDEIRLYNSPLNMGSIAAIYNDGNGLPLQAYGSFPTVTVSAISAVAFSGFSGSLPTIPVTSFTGFAIATSPNAVASGPLPTIVLTPPAGMGGLLATGNIGSIQVTSFSGYAFSGGYGDLGTISVTGLAGKGTSFPNATFGNPIFVRPFAGSALSNKSTSGSLATVTVSAMAASRSGGATTSGGLASIAVSGITATTSASAVASAGFAAANVNTSAAFGSGVGTIAVAMPSITMSAASGSASGGGATSRPMLEVAVSFAGLVTATGTAVVSRPFVIVTMTAPSTSITASSFVSAAFVSITMSAAAGAASGGALASRALADVAVVALSGSVSGTATVSAGMATVSIVAFGMTASAGGSTAGSLPVVTVTTPAGLSIGSSTTTAAMAVVSVSALIGTGKVNVVAAGSLATISITASAGSATGSLVGMAFSPVAMAMALGSAVAVSTGTGGLQTVTMSAPAGASIGGVIGSGPGPQVYVIAPTGKAFTGSTAGGKPGSVNLYDIPVI